MEFDTELCSISDEYDMVVVETKVHVDMIGEVGRLWHGGMWEVFCSAAWDFRGLLLRFHLGK